MKFIIKSVLTGVVFLGTQIVVAGQYIAVDAKLISVFNTDGNTASFGVTVSGGSSTDSCTGQITFPVSASDVNIHNRAYSTALTALTTGMSVDIHNYQGTDCNNAAFIRIKK